MTAPLRDPALEVDVYAARNDGSLSLHFDITVDLDRLHVLSMQQLEDTIAYELTSIVTRKQIRAALHDDASVPTRGAADVTSPTPTALAPTADVEEQR